MNRLIANAIWLSYATTAACLAPEITADTNRDGNVDQSDRVANKGEWSAEQGAIFLPNIGDKNMRCARRDATGNPLSNDELAYCSDASGHLLLAPEFAAPLRTAAMSGLSENAVAHVYGTPRAAYERTRIFYLENAAQPNATESWRLVDQELSFNSSQLSAGLTLAIDGRELVKDASVWDGTVVVKFDVTDGADHAVDSVALKMAPVLTHHHLQHVETFLTTGANGSDPIQSEFVRQLDVARQAAGVTKPLLLFNQSDDIWAQDFIEPAYASMPGPQGPVAIRIMLRSAQSTRTGGRQVFEQLRGPGIGGYQPISGTGQGFGHREINSYGNLETIPPYTSRNGTRWPAGRTIMGKHFDRMPAIVPFLEAQRVQSPLILETGWMVIGHVDEFVQFLPFNNSLGFTIAIADTHSALEMLKGVQASGNGKTNAISFNGTTDFPVAGVGMTVDQLMANETFITVNAYAQKYIDANLETLLAEIPLDRAQVVREGEYLTGSFWPANINGVVIGKHYVTPRSWGPVVDGVDVLQKRVEAAYAQAGMTISYVDDFLSHHSGFGDVHCGSNTFRQTDMAWWK
ncbi:Protein-arginine deiminase type-3 [Apiospora arundinis]|uniref:Protein-arginine deiminase type-3 n=1 Tax=Apiospora arundinis TaxID=335852 RepID=A0ABR2IW79_9PEZI